MITVISLLVLYSAYLLLTFMDRTEKLALYRLALLLGLVVLACITIAKHMAYAMT